MGDVINLNKYRKKLRKEKKSRKSAENRVRFGRVKADKDLATARAAKEEHDLELKRIETIPFVGPSSDVEETEDDQDDSSQT